MARSSIIDVSSCSMRKTWLGAACAILLIAVVSCGEKRESVKPGINDKYRDPDLKVQEWIDRFEGESREVFQCRNEIMSLVQVPQGATVADVGSGTGLFIPYLAEKTGTGGTVIAVDIVPKFLDHVRQKAAERNLKHVETHLCAEDSIKLPRNSLDVIFTCDTYHHFEYPAHTLKSMFEAMKKGGMLYVIDFERVEGVSREWIMGHVRAGKSVVKEEITSAGFQFVEEITPECLEENYLIRFTKP